MAGAKHGYAQIEIADDGVGMDEETQRRCLEPIFTTKGERGTGLGLAMAFGAVKRHGAEIEIRSAPGTGTSVYLKFPLTARPRSQQAAKIARASRDVGAVLPAGLAG